MPVVTKKKADRMQKAAGIQADNQLSKNCQGEVRGGGEEWKAYRNTEIYTVDNLQDLKFDLEGNTNPAQVQGMKRLPWQEHHCSSCHFSFPSL